MMRANVETAADRGDVVVHREMLSTAWLLTGGLAHEINNALSALMANLANLSDLIADPSSQARQEITAAQDAAQHITTVVRNMQRLLRSEGRTALIDARAAVERAVRLASRRAEPVCRMRAELAEVPRIRGNETWLTQIALNLILNAIEACRAGAPRSGQVLVSLHRTGDSVELSVSDDGIGIDYELAERIFRTIACTPAVATAGIGLAVTCRLITAMGGVVEFDSEPNVGTSFQVRFPAAANMP
jgi:signal transduction histidine kinase